MTLAPIGAKGLDLTSEDGLTAVIARALHRLSEMPFDVRVAHAIAQLVPTQLKVIDAGDLRDEMEELEDHLRSKERQVEEHEPGSYDVGEEDINDLEDEDADDYEELDAGTEDADAA